MKHLGSITDINGATIEPVDCITGGSPCQDLSVVGKRAGLAGERSGLFMEQIRLVKEMRENERRNGRTGINIRPRWMVWENVVGVFSSNKGADFQAVLTEIVRIAEPDAPDVPMPEKGKWGKAGELHDEMGRWSVAWRTHDAQYWGVPQRRKRISVVADFSGGAQRKSCLTNILEQNPNPKYNLSPRACQGILERAKRRGKKLPEILAMALTVQSGGAISFQERAGKPGGGKGILIQNERTGALSTLNNQSVFGIPAYNSNVMKSANPNSGYVEEDSARTLDGNGASPDHYQGGTAIVYRKQGHPQNAEQPQKWEQTETADTLNVSDNTDARTPILIKQEVFENHTQDSRYKPLGEVCSTLATNLGTGGNNQPLVVSSSGGDVSGTLDASYYKGCGERQNVEREVVCVGNGQIHNITMNPVANTLDTMHDAQAILSYGVDCYNQEEKEEVTTTIRAKADNDHIPCTYSLDRAYFNQGKNAQYNPSVSVETTQTIVSKGPNAVGARDSKGVGIVRRLTPIECERLQGFPSGWTDIGEWVDSKGKKHKEADSPRYKALGNSITLPFWFWLLRRISATYSRRATLGSLFDGIGGFPYAWEMCNGKGSARWASEIEEFAIAVTKKHFPESEE